jgi:charged multivesicular body protein 6
LAGIHQHHDSGSSTSNLVLNHTRQTPTTKRLTTTSRAILDLKIQRDKLHQYQRRITVLTDRETAIAKQMLAQNDKKRALLALRRKKYQESLLAKTDAQLEQLEKLTSSVEFALIQKDVVFGLQQGTKVLQEIHAEMGGIEHVEKLMGETADAIAYQKVRLGCLSTGLVRLRVRGLVMLTINRRSARC